MKVKDGTKISLVLDSRGISNRVVTTINNNHFEFSGTNQEIEGACLFYENDLLNNDGRLMYFGFVLGKQINIKSENDSLHSFIVVAPDKNNKELQEYTTNFSLTCDSVYKSDKYNDLTYDEINLLLTRKLVSLNLPVNSLVKLKEISIFYNNEEISDSLMIEFLRPLQKDLRQSYYYKSMMKKIGGKKLITINNPLIDFQVEDSSGRLHKISSILKNNKIIVFDFYTTWCGPCRALSKDLKHYYQLCHDKGLEVVAVSCDNIKEDWKEYLQKENPEWMNFWLDKSGFTDELYVHGYPSVYYVDAKGIIIGSSIVGLHKTITSVQNKFS